MAILALLVLAGLALAVWQRRRVRGPSLPWTPVAAPFTEQPYL